MLAENLQHFQERVLIQKRLVNGRATRQKFVQNRAERVDICAVSIASIRLAAHEKTVVGGETDHGYFDRSIWEAGCSVFLATAE